MPDPPPRTATLVLVTPEGQVVGSLPPFPVATPWWQEAEPVVQGAREHHGVKVTVLRLLETETPDPQGGAVTYLAEVREPVAGGIAPWSGDLEDHPLRARWARPGGPAADLEWADSVLSYRGLVRTGPAQQVRSWNLSSLWRLPVQGQTVWLKVVPPFFAHEGDLLARLAGGPFPELLGHEGPRMLLAEIPGEDLYGVELPQLVRMVTVLVWLQRDWVGRVDELLGLGLPDWRGAALTEAVAAVVDRTAADLPTEDRRTLSAFVDRLPAIFTEVAACGLPETLVHGDFHPGNFRGDIALLVLLDWGDSGVGHPLLDQPAFLHSIPKEAVVPVREHWHREWRTAVPGSDPERAAERLAPIAAARQAVIYQTFLDNIEPSERVYHRADPAAWLTRTAQLVRDSRRPR